MQSLFPKLIYPRQVAQPKIQGRLSPTEKASLQRIQQKKEACQKLTTKKVLLKLTSMMDNSTILLVYKGMNKKYYKLFLLWSKEMNILLLSNIWRYIV